MTLPIKPPKRLFKTKDIIHSYQHDRSPKKRLREMTRDHVDVLEYIEFALLAVARRDSTIDDHMIDHVLRIGIKGSELSQDADVRVIRLWQRLKEEQLTRSDIAQDLWIEGLRTVHDSVRRHSDRRPGETAYLDFINEYVR
jgi:hypothetical protein